MNARGPLNSLMPIVHRITKLIFTDPKMKLAHTNCPRNDFSHWISNIYTAFLQGKSTKQYVEPLKPYIFWKYTFSQIHISNHVFLHNVFPKFQFWLNTWKSARSFQFQAFYFPHSIRCQVKKILTMNARGLLNTLMPNMHRFYQIMWCTETPKTGHMNFHIWHSGCCNISTWYMYYVPQDP